MTKITSDMVGLAFEIVKIKNRDFDETDVYIKIPKLSDEGLEIFGVKND